MRKNLQKQLGKVILIVKKCIDIILMCMITLPFKVIDIIDGNCSPVVWNVDYVPDMLV